jgi:hypothetical protein
MANRNSDRLVFDRAEIKGTARITKDGYFVADALVARANNIQTYRAHELGLTDREPQEVVRVFRPEAEVFHKDALASLAHRPITLDHPADLVDAGNWKELAVGDVGDEMLRDGEFIRVPIKIMDAKAVASIKTDRREFSLGYGLKLDMTPGLHDGQAYDAVARELRYNHLAAVRAARGGAELRIVDERTYDLDGDGGKNPASNTSPRDGDPKMKIRIGDTEVDPTNAEAVGLAVDSLNAKLADATKRATDAEAKVVEHTATITAKDEKIAELEKAVADSAITPQKLADAAKEFADVQAKAKALGVTVAEDADTAAIKKAVVDAKMGDAAKDYGAEHIAIAFAALTKDAKADQPDKLRDAIRDAAPPTDEVKTAYDEMVTGLTTAWQRPAKAA